MRSAKIKEKEDMWVVVVYRVGLSSCGFELNEAAFEGLSKAGIGDIEISLGFEKYSGLDHVTVGRLAEKYGVRLWSYHLPFNSRDELNIASLDETLRQSSVALLEEYIKKGADIGVDKFVVHPCGEPAAEEGAEREEHMKRAMQSLDTLAETAYKCGAVVAVEDLPRSCLGRDSDEILKLISVNAKLRVCFDTNHLLIENNMDFVEKVAGKIATLHVSDYDFVNERHWLPGEGKNDWQRLYQKIRDSGYDGVWMYEIGLKCPNTIYRDRDLCFGDFVRNANEIFEGRPLTVLGRPKENLGMWG